MLKNIKIKTLIILVLSFLTMLLVAIGVLGMYSLNNTAHKLQDISLKDISAMRTVENIRFKMEINRSQILQALQHNPEMEWSKLHDHQLSIHAKVIAEATTEILNTWAQYVAGLESPEEKNLANEWHAKSGRLGIDGITASINAIQENKWNEAESTLIRVINPTYRTADVALLALTEFLKKRAESNNTAVKADIVHAKRIMVAVLVAGTLLSIVAGIFLVRSITIPLNEAVKVACLVAKGDLTGRINVTSTNEIGQLLLALKEMNISLTKIVHNVRSATHTIATASNQIASGNLDLSSRTEQQASSLEETASSMEELTGTIKQNGDNARQANQLALSAADVAVKGGTVVSEVVTTMGSINESAKKIVDIIGVINSIAFQTNILALNAAVEAARAGEQGRGFAVVASEVRNLAQRSAGAAEEIKKLIGDSVDRVEVGTRLVDQAGTRMGEIVASIKSVTDIMGDIESASQEQSVGIEQINQAVNHMDQMTQQNATLVEEAAAAAESLAGQMNELVQLMSIFKISEDSSDGMNKVIHIVDQPHAIASSPIGSLSLKKAAQMPITRERRLSA